jgi:CubicO group peptidase (beta-lactamase class C family)
MPVVRRLALAAAVLLVGPWVAIADDFDAVRAVILREVQAGSSQSLALSVAVRGRTIWAEGFGWADRERELKATPDTAYLVGSLTKPMTATAIMLLVQRGLVDLDASVNEYLGEVAIKARIGDVEAATVRRVLTHTAGFGAHYQVFFIDETATPPPMAEIIGRYGQLLWPPGESFRYSNLGYGVLGEIIDRHSGQRYSEFMREHVYLPLEMKNTCLGLDERPSGEYAAGYGPDQTKLPEYRTAHAAAADVWSSANDLVRFGQLHCEVSPAAQPAILSAAAIKEMQTSTVPMGADQYGLGWVVTKDSAGRRRIRHGGAGAGCGAELCLIPAEQLVISVLVNGDTYTPGDGSILPTRIADAIVECILSRPEEASQKSTAIAPAAVDDQSLDDIRGAWRGYVETYQGQRKLTLSIEPSGVRVLLGHEASTPLEGTKLRGGNLTGKFRGDLATEDTRRRPSQLQLDVSHRDERLCGSVTSFSTHPTRGGAFAHWVDLRRIAHDADQ